MSGVSKEIDKVQKGTIRKEASSIVEANILALGAQPGKYRLRLRNGAVINNVTGPQDLSVGQSVAVAVYPGRLSKYTILGTGNRSTGTIREVWV